MSSLCFSNIPTWLIKPSHFSNVISNQLSSLKEVPSFINLDDSSHFTSGLRQALFWRRRLSPSASPNTVIFSFLGPQGLVLPNVLEVCQALKSICDMHNSTEFYRAANSNFIGISFNNPGDASKVRSLFSYYSNSIVIHVPLHTSSVHHFKLLWLPPLFPDSRIHHFLAKHSTSHKFTRELILTDTNTFSPTNAVSGTLQLLPNANITQLPHLITLPAPHLGNALLIISGRPSLCLRCGLTGHIRRFCSTSRCSSCRLYHSTSISCSSHSNNLDPALSELWDPSLADLDAVSMQPILSDNSSPLIPSNNSDLASVYDPPGPFILDTPLHNVTSSTSSTSMLASSALNPLKCDRTPDTAVVFLEQSDSSSSQTISGISPLVSSTPPDDFTIVTKHHSRHMSACKRTFNNHSYSSTSALETRPDHPNLFTTLTDEADNMYVVPSSNDDLSSSHTLTQSHPSSQDDHQPDHTSNVTPSSHPALLNLPQVLQKCTPDLPTMSPNVHSSDDPPHQLSSKRAKPSPPDFASTSAVIQDPMLFLSSPSWAEQVDLDLAVPELSITLDPSELHSSSTASSDSDGSHPNSQAHDLSSYSSPHSSSSINPGYDLDFSSAFIVYITGFPHQTNRGIVASFLGSSIPHALWHIRGPNNSFIGHFAATFHSFEEASLAVSMDGQLYNNHRVSIRHDIRKS